MLKSPADLNHTLSWRGSLTITNFGYSYYGSGGLHPEVQVKADHIWGIRIKKNDR